MREVHGYAKQGAGFGYSGVRGLNALLATISTPLAAPVIAATRLRRGAAYSPRGAARLLTEALGTARATGAGGPDQAGLVIMRADSAYYTHDMVAAARRGGARFSITAKMTATVKAAIAGIDESAWTPIHYPRAVFDQDEQRSISDVEVAEVAFTAFTGRRRAEHVTARLIVRRVRRLAAAGTPAGQGELFAAHRHHAVFTDSPLTLREAETSHRGHAIVEQVIANLKNGPLAHLPSGKFAAISAWPVLAATAFNLLRAAGTLASPFHARATTATIRAQLIAVPVRLAHSARRLRLHLPRDWPWKQAWTQLFDATCGPPTPACPPPPPTRTDRRPTVESRTARQLLDARIRTSRSTRHPLTPTKIDGGSGLSDKVTRSSVSAMTLLRAVLSCIANYLWRIPTVSPKRAHPPVPARTIPPTSRNWIGCKAHD